MSFPVNVGQIPMSYDELPTGRPYDPNNKYTSRYLDVANAPEYPFGYGLSYTSFSISNVSAPSSVSRNGTIKVTATVTNTGSVTGTDVAQLYIHESDTTILQPVEKLEGFQRVTLDPGKSQDGHVHARTAEPRLLRQQRPLRGRAGAVRRVGRRQLDRGYGYAHDVHGRMRVRGLIAAAAAAAILVVAAPAGAATFSPQQRGVLLGIARDTWRFYGADVDPVTHLPLDNLGPGSVRGEYTSAANVGVYLWAVVAAHDLGLIDTARADQLASSTLNEVAKLKRYDGFLYQWYDTNNGDVLSNPGAGRLHRDDADAGQLLVRLGRRQRLVRVGADRGQAGPAGVCATWRRRC